MTRARLRRAHRSKTIQMAVAIAGLGALETQIQVVPEQYQGFALIVIAMLVAYLRLITTTDLAEK